MSSATLSPASSAPVSPYTLVDTRVDSSGHVMVKMPKSSYEGIQKMRLNRQLWDHDDIVHEAKNEGEIRDFFKSVYDDGI